MDRERFNRDMGSYLRSKRENESSKSFTLSLGREKSKKPKSDKPKLSEMKSDKVYVEYDDYDSGEGFWERLLSFFVSGYEEEEVDRPEELTPAEMERLEKMKESKVKKEDIKYKNIEELDRDIKVPKPNFMDKMLSFFGFGEEIYDEYQEIEQFDPDDYAIEESERLMYEEDVKNIIKIAHTWIEKLPAKTKKEFKESDDFEEYKKLLDKLGMLKK